MNVVWHDAVCEQPIPTRRTVFKEDQTRECGNGWIRKHSLAFLNAIGYKIRAERAVIVSV
jgi:hypothetical protein